MQLVTLAIFGLPSHVLVVHAAVVLVPLAAAGFIATGWRKEWRSSYGLPLVLIALAGAAAAIIAASSGEELESSVRHAAGTRVSFGDHPEEGESARTFAILFGLGAVAVWSMERWGAQIGLKNWSVQVGYVVGSALGVAAIATMVLAGHSGASLVWKDLGNFVSSR